TNQPVSSDDEWDYLFDTSQHGYDFDDKRGFDDEQGFVDGRDSDNEEGFVDERGSNNEQNSGDEWDSDSLNEDSQDPNNPLTWKFSKQVAAFTSEEIEEIETVYNTIDLNFTNQL
ncbi:364_t:CDS:2, partial [Racocetra persica]